MARSGYEIRLDVLRMAKDLADDRYHHEYGRRQDMAGRNNSDFYLPLGNIFGRKNFFIWRFVNV